MEGVASVERTGETHLHWVAKVMDAVAEVENETREWDARITEQVRDSRVSWESIGERPEEKPNGGRVTFEPLGDKACRVTFSMHWEPEAGLEANQSYMLAAVDQVVAADLGRFKDFMETRAGGTGAR